MVRKNAEQDEEMGNQELQEEYQDQEVGFNPWNLMADKDWLIILCLIGQFWCQIMIGWFWLDVS